MAVDLVDSQGNPIMGEGDADQLTPEEIEALKKEGEVIPAETPPVKEEKPPVVETKQPPQRNLEGETARLREERNRLREERSAQEVRYRELQEENLRLKTRRDLQREETERATGPTRPDPVEDPIGAELWDLKQEAAENKKLREKWDAREKQQAEQQERWNNQVTAQREIKSYLDDDVAKYREEHPDIDYNDASNYLYGKYTQYWKRRGLTDQEVTNLAGGMFMSLGATAKERGGSAAEAVVELASEMGYKPTAKLDDNSAPKVNMDAAKAKLERIKKGQQLQGLGGKTGTQRNPVDNVAGMTAEEIANMSDDDFVALKQDKILGKALNRRNEELG